ncbi:MAG TPA: zf-HC2 domain-containing protein [Acidimicrobiales bacterium]|nr:zf-HC2 domain-containing protein [Acidimicrobiales bacterium]
MERLTGHAELQELLGAYALDAVDPEEAAVIELHLATCPRCRTELAEHREVAALLGYAGGSAPRGVWDRIISSLEEPPPALDLTRARRGTEPPRLAPPGIAAPPPVPDRGTTDDPASQDVDGITQYWSRRQPRDVSPIVAPWSTRREPSEPESNVVPIGSGTPATGSPGAKSSRWRTGVDRLAGGPSGRHQRTVPMRLLVAIATTAALIVAALGIEVGRLENHKASQVNLASLAYQMASADPGARHVTLESANGARAVPAVIVPGGETYLGPGDLQVLPNSETYQMWGIVNGSKVSLGVIGDNATYATFTTPPVATALAMTIESRGGVVTSTKTPVIEGSVPD